MRLRIQKRKTEKDKGLDNFRTGVDEFLTESLRSDKGLDPKMLCEKIRHSSYIEGGHYVLRQRLETPEYAGVMAGLVEARRGIDHYGIRDQREVLVNALGYHAARDPRVRDAVLEGIRESPRGCSPDVLGYELLCEAVAMGYDGQVLDAFSELLQGNHFGPFNTWEEKPLVGTILGRTFNEDTPLDLRRRGVRFCLEELDHAENREFDYRGADAKVGNRHPFDTPRNVMYLPDVARALVEHRKDPVVQEHGDFRVPEAIDRYAGRLMEVAKFRAALWLKRIPNSTWEEKFQGLFNRYEQGGFNGVRDEIEPVGVEDMSHVSAAGADRDSGVAICYNTARTLRSLI